MREQRIIWTACPNGIRGGKLKLSVFVAPRLRTDEGLPRPPLSLFPDWRHWPARNVSFQVAVAGKPPVNATITSGPKRVDLWNSLFTNNTFVRPWVFENHQNEPIMSYPAANVRSFLNTRYRKLAAEDGAEYPTATKLLGTNVMGGIFYGPNNPEDHQIARIRDDLTSYNESGHYLRAQPPDAGFDLEALKLFHGGTAPTAPPVLPDIDFHQVIAALADQPPLLRLLGLVYDLEIPLPGGFPGVAADRFVSVIPNWTPLLGALGTTINVTPRTAYDGDFLADGRTSNPYIGAGLLKANTNTFELVEVDVDGGGLKALAFVAAMAAAIDPAHSSDDTPERWAVPSLRTGGLSLAWEERAGRLSDTFDSSTNNDFLANQNPPGDIVLYGEDLTRGFRVDIWDDASDAWHQLHARQAGVTGGYRFPDIPATVPIPPGDEGWTALAVTPAYGTEFASIQLHEWLFRWNGWSLAAPRPGNTLADTPDASPEPPPGNPATTAFHMEVAYAVTPGTLPVLRFGRNYRVRARAVDLCGNSVPFSPTANAASFASASSPRFYARMEPVVSPALVMRKPRTEGESTERLVIRSNYNIPDGNPSILSSQRHVAPPTTSQLQAEEHGLFDVGGKPSKPSYDGIVARDGKTFASLAGGVPDPKNYDQPYFDVGTLTVPYLPDLFARGAALVGLPGGPPAGALKVQFPVGAGGWPDVKSFRIVLVPGTGAPTLAGNVLTVRIPKAVVAKVRLSSFFGNPDLLLMGIWRWLQDAGLDTAALSALILDGRHWMFTPYREITLVHAVRQPLAPPQITALSALRSAIGQTTAILSGNAKVDRPSTQELEIRGVWDEPIDNLNDPGPTTVSGKGRAFKVPLAADDPAGNTAAINGAHEFNDTKHREVYYEAVATTRFGEYFADTATPKLNGTTPFVLKAAGLAPGMTKVTSLDDATTFRVESDFVLDDDAGTIARTATSTIPTGTKVKVHFVAQPITRSSLEQIVPPAKPKGFLAPVPNSSRPTTVDLRYVVPAFDWARKAASPPGPDAMQSVRGGGLLRVYLGRPWFNSGEGELLGVVFLRGAATVPLELQPYCTAVGRDPIWLSAKALTALNATSFPLATTMLHNLSLAETGASLFSAAGHPVGYDSSRRLWFSDIQLSPGQSYTPFVRLALARFQPTSIANAHLSQVVIADVSQLLPDRTAIIAFSADDPTKASVTVSGVTYGAPNGSGFSPAVMNARAERRRAGVSGDLGWVSSGPDVVLTRQPPALGVTTWTGNVTLPGERGQFPMRILVSEQEQFPNAGAPVSRVVYMDSLEF